MLSELSLSDDSSRGAGRVFLDDFRLLGVGMAVDSVRAVGAGGQATRSPQELPRWKWLAALFSTNTKKETAPATYPHDYVHNHATGLGGATELAPADSNAPSWSESGLLAMLTFMIASRIATNVLGSCTLVKKSARLSTVFTYGTLS